MQEADKVCPIFADPDGAIFGNAITFGRGANGPNGSKNVYFVDGTNGSDGNNGKTWARAKSTIQGAVDVAVAGDTIYVVAKEPAVTDTDPSSYAETVIIDVSNLSLIGVSRGRTQGGLPQIKKGSGSTALLTIRAPGCLIANLGFNGASATGGGILLDDDGGSTKSAFGTTIRNCHFKNCQNSGAAATGGAIQWSSSGGAWQVLIEGCEFYECRCGISLIGTGGSRPKDVVVRGCSFNATANTTVDADIWGAGGSGFAWITIENCEFNVVDVPAYASSPSAARYMDLTGCAGAVTNCRFACISAGTSAKTFKAAGTGAKIPTTVRIAGCKGEPASDATVMDIVRAA